MHGGAIVRFRWPVVLLALLAAAAWLAVPILLERVAPSAARAQAAYGGRLAVGRPDGLWILPLDGSSPSKLVDVSGGPFITGVSWSPAGDRVAYAHFSFEPGGAVGGADLHLVDLSGADRVLVDRDDPDTLLGSPTWLADGSGLLFDVAQVAPGGGASRRIERVAADGSGREALVVGGFAPSLSADGRWLAYLRPDAGGAAIYRHDLANGTDSLVVAGGTVSGIITPSPSPDGALIVFGAAGGPGLTPSMERCPSLAPQAHLLVPAPALAHGLPEELWRVAGDGSGLRRVTNLCLDDPIVAWSPDGQWLAAYGATGLVLLPAAGGAAIPVWWGGGYGGVRWAP
jgi:Tol biopolymer transport system component